MYAVSHDTYELCLGGWQISFRLNEHTHFQIILRGTAMIRTTMVQIQVTMFFTRGIRKKDEIGLLILVTQK